MQTRIRAMREDKDLTQQQVALYLLCDQSLYSKYERGEREMPMALMVKLAYYYDVGVEYLLGMTDVKGYYPRKKL